MEKYRESVNKACYFCYTDYKEQKFIEVSK